MKKNYQTPKMEVMDCKVEKGFLVSGGASNPDGNLATTYSGDFTWSW